MNSTYVATLITAFLTIISIFLGVKYRRGLEKARLFVTLLNDIISAAEDDKVSEEEFKQIIAKAKQLAAKEGN
jgi:CRISPR/Cas system CSM-associated protein Csm2 small subunit